MVNDKFGREILPGNIVLSVNKNYGDLRFAIGVIQNLEEVERRGGAWRHYKIRLKKFDVHRGWDPIRRDYTDEITVYTRLVNMTKPKNMVVMDEGFLATSCMEAQLQDAILADIRRINSL